MLQQLQIFHVYCSPTHNILLHFHLDVVHTLRQWNKETFDYLLSFLSSPESVKMGIFLQSGYNLLTERAPVRRALFFT